MHVATIQFPVRMDVAENLHDLAAALRGLEPGTLAVAPEGSLSGYEPVPGFTNRLDPGVISQAIETARGLAEKKGVHLVIGACVFERGAWLNSSFYMGPKRELFRYDKINLAQSERGTFRHGDDLPVREIRIDGNPVRLGIQMCREIRYPEQWRILAARGAQIVAYVNNAVNGANGPDLWRSHLISRAAETQRFVVGANNAAIQQLCPSMIIAPSGDVLSEVPIGATAYAKARINLGEVSDWVIGQARDDVVSVCARD
jgi:predicted amidohydrolase